MRLRRVLCVAAVLCSLDVSVKAQVLAFSRVEWNRSDVVLLDTATGVTRVVASAPGLFAWSPVWSSAGDRLAWLEWDGRTAAIAIAREDGQVEERLTGLPPPRRPEVYAVESASSLTWSTDARRFAYTIDFGPLVVVDRDAGSVTVAEADAAPDDVFQWFFGVVWWPDSRNLLSLCNRMLYLLAMDGSVLSSRSLEVDGGMAGAASVDAASGRIAFLGEPEYGCVADGPCEAGVGFWPQIHWLEPTAARAQRLTGSLTRKAHPAWTPDGQAVSYSEEHHSGWNIVSVSILDQGVTAVVQGEAQACEPAWRPLRPSPVDASTWGQLKHGMVPGHRQAP